MSPSGPIACAQKSGRFQVKADRHDGLALTRMTLFRHAPLRIAAAQNDVEPCSARRKYLM